MLVTTATDEASARRRAWRLAILDALAIALSSPFLVTVVSVPAIAVILASVPQVAVFVPEPVREVALVMDGMIGLSDELTQGADGVDGAELEEEAPVIAPPTPDAAAPGTQGDEAKGDAVADANPGDKPKSPPAMPPGGEAASEPASADPPSHEAADATQGSADAAGDGAGTTPEAAGQADAKPPRKSGRSGKCAEPNPAIAKLGDTMWSVQRDLIDYYTANMERFNSLGYSHKWEDESGAKGWQIGGFGCSSPLWKAGLRSQDVIQEVNGKKTNNVVQLIGIWISQRKKADFEVRVLRKGEPVVLSYRVL